MTSIRFEFGPTKKAICLLLIAFGVVVFFVGIKSDPTRLWANFLLQYFFWMSLGLSGVFFTALQYSTGASWSAPLRRIPEAFTAFLPVAVLLFFVLTLGRHHLYEWTHTEAVAHDLLLTGKRAYLNFPFFFGRNLAVLLVWVGVGAWLVKNSLTQDKTAAVHLTKRNTIISVPFLVFFALSFTMTSFDLLMSLEPHWYSTIFGVYCWAGLFYSGLAMITLWAIWLRKTGPLEKFVNENHLHDAAKLMFGFCVFWAYIAFSQYLLIWYANMPEETFYLIERTSGPWATVALALLFGKFLLPFLMLLSRPAKRKENFLLLMTFWFLGAHLLDLYWLIFPTFFKSPVFGWMELGLLAGFAGLFFLVVASFLERVSCVAIGDPRLKEGLQFQQ